MDAVSGGLLGGVIGIALTMLACLIGLRRAGAFRPKPEPVQVRHTLGANHFLDLVAGHTVRLGDRYQVILGDIGFDRLQQLLDQAIAESWTPYGPDQGGTR